MSEENKENSSAFYNNGNESSLKKYTVDQILEEYTLKENMTDDKPGFDSSFIRIGGQTDMTNSDDLWVSEQLCDGDTPEAEENINCRVNDIPVPKELRNAEPANSNIIYEDGYEADRIIGRADKATSIKISESITSEALPKSARLKKYLVSFLPHKDDEVKEIIRKIIFLASVIVLIYGTVILISTFIQSRLAIADQKEIKDYVTTEAVIGTDSNGNIITIEPTDEQRLEHSQRIIQYYSDINSDVKGFLTIENCNIYMPVVQGEDNEYYLTHTYKKTLNKAGSIFMDSRCTVSENYVSPNIVLYGHNQKDGTMFGNLKEYKKDVEYYKKHPIFEFDTQYGLGEYVIYACFVTNTLEKQDRNGEVFHYHDYIETLNDRDTFNWYIDQIYQRNEYITPVDVKYGDKLLTLSTCSNEFSNLRFVICARKLRDGETKDSFDFSSVELNQNAKTIDYYAITSNITAAPIVTEPITSQDTVVLSESDINSDTEDVNMDSDTESTVSAFDNSSATSEQYSESTAPPQTEEQQTTTVTALNNNGR
jgi:sortase B